MNSAIQQLMALLAVFTLWAGPRGAQDLETAGREYFGDIPLVNQDGEEVRLYSDLLRGKVVVIHSFFASCRNTCPVMAATLARVQNWLGERLGREVHLLSFTVDPGHDTPEVLKDYARRFEAREGWHFLTGEKENVRRALGKLGQFVENKEAHKNLIVIGNEPTGLWKKVFGLSDPGLVIQVVDSVIKDEE